MDKLLKQKRVIKGKITRFCSLIENISNENILLSSVDVYLEDLQSLNSELNVLFEELLTTCEDKDYDKYEHEMHDELDKLDNEKLILRKLKNSLISQTETNTNQTTINNKNLEDTNVKLPRLDLPSFSGNLIEWISFRDLFNASVHDNKSLSRAQKLQYLKLSLKGEAAYLLHSVQISDENYQKAWNILKDRYENEDEIINATLDKLFSQPQLTHESSYGIRKLIDVTTQCLDTLEILKQPIEKWDTILIYILKKKLDNETLRVWMLDSVKGEERTFIEFKKFLSQRAAALASLNINKPQLRSEKNPKVDQTEHKSRTGKYSSTHHAISNSCLYCREESHLIYNCDKFLSLSNSNKWDFIRKNKLCSNCLKANHFVKTCNKGKCKICNLPHNTILHVNKVQQNNEAVDVKKESELSQIVSNSVTVGQGVLLPTAIIYVYDNNGAPLKCRALLDSASQSSFITESCVNTLNLKRNHININITGLSSRNVCKVKGAVKLNVSSVENEDKKINFNALIIKKITCDLPQFKVAEKELEAFKNLKLADPTCNQQGPIDVLLGADIYADIMLGNRFSAPGQSLVAHETEFGFIIMGRTITPSEIIAVNHACCDINYQLDKFWELEEVSQSKLPTPEEAACENHFHSNYSRDSNGRFIVKLPFRDSDNFLGSSRDMAVSRFLQTERRFARNSELSAHYHEFMNEYLNLGHMELVPSDELNKVTELSYYLPHHAVPNKLSHKFRVVFDGSAKSSNGISLNDLLMVGPQLQDGLIPLLMRFRMKKYAFTADIVKMYRQVRVRETDFQRIVWRDSPKKPIQEYRLLTVTYGTSSAPYLATKCLQQLAKEEESRYPEASNAILKDFYVDDFMSGADSIPEALNLQNDVIRLLSEGGFELKKWSSNVPELLSSLPADFIESTPSHCIDDGEKIKTLGLLWHPSSDTFSFSVNFDPVQANLTKRMLLSNIARVFDPLGWISPITIRCKILMQGLWKTHLDWDDEIPPNLLNEWCSLLEDLYSIKSIKIPRYVITYSDSPIELIGFSDSSLKAYSAVVYARSVCADGRIQVQLLASKTRVSPLRTVSLPRLELCGALLLAKLMHSISETLQIEKAHMRYFTDSTIVLYWLASSPSRWKTFVANRVAKIHQMSSVSQWFHVKSKQNPADSATRGITTKDLILSSLWWTGPTFLLEPDICVCESPCVLRDASNDEALLELKPNEFCESTLESFATTVKNSEVLDLLQRYSSLSKSKRITAYCLRFLHNLRNPENPSKGFLTTKELDSALKVWIKIVQSQEFSTEIMCLQSEKPLSCSSKIRSLNPFVDSEGILRVGGRLRHAKVAFGQKHPILLPKGHLLTDMLIRDRHLSLLHAGPQLVQSSLQEVFWIIGARDVIRKIIKKCVPCARIKAEATNQLMGDLPTSRITPAPAFLRCGVDYAGPFQVKRSKGRGQKTIKVYIALFVCFVTRAVHLEVVSDLSTDAFIAALKRFISRRGKCSDIFSDCGTNFIGAKRKLAEFEKLVLSERYNSSVSHFLSDIGISWHFNPPGSPHMGGLWEAGIKSTKFHLKRVVGDLKLTIEEFETLLTQIEACLNSRPLTPMSSDPDDLCALTPGHFLVGRSLASLPEPNYLDVKLNSLSRWQLMQRALQQFWKRWHREYLCRLQQRPKWLLGTKNVEINDLVLLKEDNLPPTKWKLARIINVHPGSDGLVRVVTLKTSDGVYQRNITKICQLPI